MKKYLLLYFLALTNLSFSQNPCNGLTFITYGGRLYHTVQIGSQCWLKENLNIGTMINANQQQTNNGAIEKYCYNNDIANCSVYGGLYEWAEAVQYKNNATNTKPPNPQFNGFVQGICPAGWHLPDSSDFMNLAKTVNFQGNSLKAIGQGTGIGAGTNTSGFSALLSGICFSDSSTFQLLGLYDYFLSTTQSDSFNIYYLDLGIDSSFIYFGYNLKNDGRSVRCLMDSLGSSTGIGLKDPAPLNYELAQNYPNPWNPVTTIRYQLPKNSIVTIKGLQYTWKGSSNFSKWNAVRRSS